MMMAEPRLQRVLNVTSGKSAPRLIRSLRGDLDRVASVEK
jgi:hypothetical protein